MKHEFINTSKEARTTLDQVTGHAPRTRATSYYHEPGQGENKHLPVIQSGSNQKAVVKISHLQGGEGRSPTDTGIQSPQYRVQH